MLGLKRTLWPECCGFFIDGNMITEVVAGSMADEQGLCIGDEIMAIGSETLPRYATAKLVQCILRRQPRFPPQIEVIPRVQLCAIELKPGEHHGLTFFEAYDSRQAMVRRLKSIRVKHIRKYSPGDRAPIQEGDRITHIGGISTTSAELIPYMLIQHARNGEVIVGYLPVQEGGVLHDAKLVDLNIEAKDNLVMKYSIAETQALIEKIRYILDDDELLLDPEMLQEVYDTVKSHPRREMIQTNIPNFTTLVHARMEHFCHATKQDEKGQSDQIKQVVQLASDYKMKKIDSMVELAQKLMELDPKVETGSGQIFTDLIGNSNTARLRKTYYAPPEVIDLSLKIQLDEQRAKESLKMSDVLDIIDNFDDETVKLAIVNADSRPLRLRHFEHIFMLISGHSLVDADGSKENRDRVANFRRMLEHYVPCIFDRLLLIIHSFYFNGCCDHLLADLNYTYRQLASILECDDAFLAEDDAQTENDKLADCYDAVCDLKVFCERRKDVNLLKLRALYQESRRKFASVLKKDAILSCSFQRFKRNYDHFLDYCRRRIDEITQLQRDTQSLLKRSKFKVKTVMELCNQYATSYEEKAQTFCI